MLQKSEETIVTNTATGGKKGKKLQRFSLIPRDFLWSLATHYGRGAGKYGDRNWEKGYDWSLTVDAAERHYNEFMDACERGDEKAKYDEETGSHHLIAAIWHLIALYVFDTRGLGTNDLLRDANVRTGSAQESNTANGPVPPAGTGDSGVIPQESAGGRRETFTFPRGTRE